ncbi:BAX inhibitor (BI)-1/YccA family protein [Aestuariivirga litoralis]|uniref:BAX inhibitor (BI)-1/YccA family protein n=1 Tax=Aestuariivirga litoralis TaxID=2650924 RepID=A0A2W2BAX2_9HYPH|nr:Bax inhibitor-1/YccA family protein [Aestuariivirga litoralis]PZF77268.1 BAX inhibitor (BI)-1/YccA family protein [Aestuariivirga litoralis]
MADTRFQTQVRTQSRAEIDQGLRSYMLGIYNYMALGVALTAIITLAVAASPAAMATVYSLKWVFFIAILGMGFFAPRMMMSGNTTVAQAAYWGYAALWGLAIAPMVGTYLAVDSGMVVQAFLITAVTFGATSLAGYVTKRDLSGFGGFFMMASIGIIVAILINAFFVQSTMMSLITSIITVLLFAGVTAWETQQIKEMYVEGDAPGVAKGKSIIGAYMLYGSFITLFVNILNILGIMRQN